MVLGEMPPRVSRWAVPIQSDGEYQFSSRRLNITDVSEVVSYLRTVEPIARVEVRQVVGGPGRGPEVNLSDPSRPSLRRLSIRAFGKSGPGDLLLVIELGRDTRAAARLSARAAGPEVDGQMAADDADAMRTALHHAAGLIARSGWHPPSATARWTVAMVGLVASGVGLWLWSAAVLSSVPLAPPLRAQVLVIFGLVVAGLVALAVSACGRRRQVSRLAYGRIRVSTETRSKTRVFWQSALIAVIAGGVGSFLGAVLS